MRISHSTRSLQHSLGSHLSSADVHEMLLHTHHLDGLFRTYDIRSLSSAVSSYPLPKPLPANNPLMSASSGFVALGNVGLVATVPVYSCAASSTEHCFTHLGHTFHSTGLSALALHPGGHAVASADTAGQLHVWKWD